MGREKIEYGRKPYITSLGVAFVFTFIAILSIVFNSLRIMFLGLAWWGFWMFIPAFFLYIAAVEEYLKIKRAVEQVLSFIKAYDGDVNLDKLSSELNLDYFDVKAIVADLISKEKIEARIEASTGELIFDKDINKNKVGLLNSNSDSGIKSAEENMSNIIFCPHCKASINNSLVFCPFCGERIAD